jgi:hypothetical protein
VRQDTNHPSLETSRTQPRSGASSRDQDPSSPAGSREQALPGTAPGRATRITKSLLGYGVIAGPVYVAVWLAQALTRNRFDISRHAASLLANGHLGWIQSASFLLTGAITVAAAIGIGRTLGHERSAKPAAWLIALFGLGVFAAGVFRADPAYGFPPGTPPGPARHASWHGDLHYAAGGIGFPALIVACSCWHVTSARPGSGQGPWPAPLQEHCSWPPTSAASRSAPITTSPAT